MVVRYTILHREMAFDTREQVQPIVHVVKVVSDALLYTCDVRGMEHLIDALFVYDSNRMIKERAGALVDEVNDHLLFITMNLHLLR